MKVMIMGCYMLVYSAFVHAFPWPEKSKSQQPSTTDKYNKTRYSRLLSVTYEDSSDTAASKPESRVYVDSGFRESKSCESCNSVPWIPVVKFSQRASKNIIYQEESNYEGGHDGPKTYLLPPQSQQNYRNTKASAGFHSHDSHTQHSEAKPIMTPCDLLKHNHNHDSLGSGSEAMSSVQHYQDHGVYQSTNSYKGPPSNPTTSFRYFSYIKHPDTPPRNNFTRLPPRKHPDDYREHPNTDVPFRQINQNHQKRGKDLFHHLHDYNNGLGQYDQYDDRVLEPQQVKDKRTYHTPYPRIPTILQTQPFINNWESYKIPPVLPNTGGEYNGLHYPGQFESDTNHFNAFNTMKNNYQNNVEDTKPFQSVSSGSDVPMQYLTPPKIQSGHREGKKYEHYNVPDNEENTEVYHLPGQQQHQQQDFNQQSIDHQDDVLPHLISVDDRAAQLQSISHIKLDHTELQYDENKLKTLSPIEWQCFLMNFIRYLKMSKAGHTVRMSHECDPITLQHFMTSLNTNEPTHNDGEILTNEIQSDEEDNTKLAQDNKYSNEDQNEIATYEAYQQDVKNQITNQHELVKLAPHLSGEYHVDSEYVKNYSQVAQEAVNHFIRQNEMSNENQENTTPSPMEPIWIPEQNEQSNDGFEYQKHIKYNESTNTNLINVIDDLANILDASDGKENTSYVTKFNGSIINSENVEEHYLNNQEIIDSNNMFQDMLEANTEGSLVPDDNNAISSTLYEGESYTRIVETSTTDNLEISAPNAIFYPKGFSFTNDQSNFVTEKPILLTSPKKIKIVIPYRKRSNSEMRKEKDGEDFQNSIDTWTADGFSNHKLSYDKFNQTSFNALQKSKSIPLMYLNSTQNSSTGNDQTNMTGNIPKTWEDLSVAISPYTKERVYIVTPKSN